MTTYYHFYDPRYGTETWKNNLYGCLRLLRLVSLRARKSVLLEPWLVEEALARLGEARLGREEQRVIVRATSRPHAVRWPDWWEVRG